MHTPEAAPLPFPPSSTHAAALHHREQIERWAAMPDQGWIIVAPEQTGRQKATRTRYPRWWTATATRGAERVQAWAHTAEGAVAGLRRRLGLQE